MKISKIIPLVLYFFLIFFCPKFIFPNNINFCQNKKLHITTPDPSPKGNHIYIARFTNNKLFIGESLFFDLSNDITIDIENKNKIVDMAGDSFISPAVFIVQNRSSLFSGELKWILYIYNQEKKILFSQEGVGNLPQKLHWLKDESNKEITSNNSYFYSLEILNEEKSVSFKTAPKAFAIRSVAAIKHKIIAQSFSSYENILSSKKAKSFIDTISKEIKTHPDEMLNIVAYSSKANPHICKNILRLRNFLVVKSGISLSKFHLFCDFLENNEKESEFITISGTKPTQEIELIEPKKGTEAFVELNNKELPSNMHSLFIMKNQDKQPPNLKIQSIEGEFLDAKLNLKKEYSIELINGENRFEKNIITLKDGPIDAYCTRNRDTSFKFGFGPYFISDSIKPKDLHTLAFNFNITHNLKKFFPLFNSLGLENKNFTLFFDLTTSPMSLSGSSRSNQSFYDTSGLLGYKIKFPKINLIPTLGYFLYFSNDNYFGSRELSKLIYSPLIGIKVEMTSRFLFNLASIENLLTYSPFLRGEKSSFKLNNDFKINFLLYRKYSLFFSYKKNIFRYKNIARNLKVTEGYDTLILGFKLEL